MKPVCCKVCQLDKCVNTAPLNEISESDDHEEFGTSQGRILLMAITKYYVVGFLIITIIPQRTIAT